MWGYNTKMLKLSWTFHLNNHGYRFVCFMLFPWKFLRGWAHFLVEKQLFVKHHTSMEKYFTKELHQSHTTSCSFTGRKEKKKKKKTALLVGTLKIWKCKLKSLSNYLLMLETKVYVVIYMLHCLQYLSFLSIWRPLEKPVGENQKTGLHSQHSFKFCAADNTDLFVENLIKITNFQ